MGSGPENLEDLRSRIDEIDVQLQDLLIKRSEVTRAIAAAKKRGRAFIRPAREAEVLRRLLGRHRGAFPKAVLVRIWREIFAAMTGLQGAFKVVVFAPQGEQEICRLAGEHFGSQTPVQPLASFNQVLTAVAEESGTLGVLPLPKPEETVPWWPGLARDGETAPRIIARLPYITPPAQSAELPGALAIGLLDQEDTGCDRSFVIAESFTELSRGRLREILAQAGLTVTDLQSRPGNAERWLHLVEVEGCVSQGKDSFARLQKAGETAFEQVWAIGGYAAPLTEDELANGEAVET